MQVRDFFKSPFTVDELRGLIGPRPASYFLSRRAKKYKELDLERRAHSNEELIELMVQEPTLIRRPLVVSGDTLILGFDRDALTDIT